MHARASELAGIALVAMVLTAILAWPVLRDVNARVFGVPIVGIHHDPFTMMQVWEARATSGPAFQPVTDLPGQWLAEAVGPVAAYNWLVLITFPLTAVATFALARQLGIPWSGATLAALAFAFSPFHLAHAAYHPHIAQVQCVPVYVLALWGALRRGTSWSLVALGLASIVVVLSNFYGGWIAAVLTPVLLVAGWSVWPESRARWMRVVGAVLVVGACGLVYVALAEPNLWSARASLNVGGGDLSAYSARPIAYIVPPAAHPWLGAGVRAFWHDAGKGVALLEQQVSLGWGVLALAGVAVYGWGTSVTPSPMVVSAVPLRVVPALLVCIAAAVILSASPGVVVWTGLHSLAPMFGAYARFGVMTQLMAVLLAAIGFGVLRERATTAARWLSVALVVMVVAEYVVAPSAASREVWPSTAHRWIHDHATGLRALDCTPYTDRTSSDAWLTKGRIQLLGGSFPDCGEPHLAAKLAALGFTHLLVRAGTDDAHLYAGDAPAGSGLSLVLRDADASLWQVTARLPTIFVDSMSGLLPREYGPAHSWRWMEHRADWRIMNPGAGAITATLRLELSAFARPRVATVLLNEVEVGHVMVDQEQRVHVIGPMVVPRGHHTLSFVTPSPETLSIAFGGWRWTTVPQVP